MGVFSWLDCETKEQIKLYETAFVLIPADFGGGHIKESFYEGYGEFCGLDIFELVAEWNKGAIDPEEIEPGNKMLKDYCEGVTDEIMIENYGEDYNREIGIILACEDENNAALPYPIKITHNPGAIYENCKPSLIDPNQGGY